MKQTYEFWVADTPEDAIRKVRATLQRVGDLTAVVPGQYFTGTIMALGSRLVNVRVSWRAEADPTLSPKLAVKEEAGPWQPPVPSVAPPGTSIVIEGEAEDDDSGRAAKNAFERFEDAYRHFHNPDYKPDRVGMLPYTIIGLVVIAVLMLVFFLRSPLYQKMFPKMPAHFLKDEKEKQAEAAAEKQRKEEMGETEGAGTTP
jgi:hypothetical protein